MCRDEGMTSPVADLVRPNRAPKLKEAFFRYLDYLLYSLADQHFEEKVEANRGQREQYRAALCRIEEGELGYWRCAQLTTPSSLNRTLEALRPAVHQHLWLPMVLGVCSSAARLPINLT